jgi:D-tagatose-1,6-bisphosphate aldolase subunit GatZ/KbaZ
MSHPVDEILRAQKRGKARGIASICSAHPWVLKTALRGKHPVLIEATCNQVNQFGGYTGMTSADFAAFVRRLAAENHFPVEQIILGGDHLGPSPWQNESAALAMQKAADMVRAYVQAGYTKIHLDASMRLGDDDPKNPLDLELAAQRTSLLAHVAEETLPSPVLGRGAGGEGLRYIIGTEVPPPGGATEHEESVRVTKVEDVKQTIAITHEAFTRAGLESAWEKVMGVVVQPGVEFGDDFVLPYQPAAAQELSKFIESQPLIYEAHSTDYQSREALTHLVRDHFAILKVGPALTYAFREAVFSLAMIEQELFAEEEHSQLIERLDAAMLREPRHWQNYYHGTPEQQAFARKYSLSDRIRYYWSEPTVQAALSKMLKNLKATVIPLSLISQFLPELYPLIRDERLPNSAASIINSRIGLWLEDYSFAMDSK